MSGRCDLVHLIGATASEIDKALELGTGTAGSLVLCEVFKRMGVGCVTDIGRRSLTTEPGFQQTWTSAHGDLRSQWSPGP